MNSIGKHKTRVFEDDEGYKSVTYRGCPVVTVYPKSNEIKLETCGWKSQTTKTRMNQAANQFGLPFYVFQKDYVWYVETPSGKTAYADDGHPVHDPRVHTIKDIVLD